MSYLTIAKQAQARFREAQLGYAVDANNAETPVSQLAERHYRVYRVNRVSYASPWPDEVPGLGPRRVGPLDPCEGCGLGSWVRYGPAVLCLRCAMTSEPRP